MGNTVTQTELPISTYCAWESARSRARIQGIHFHPAWNDFWVFFADVGECPDDCKLRYESASAGFVPGNCDWNGGKFARSFAECPVAVTYLKNKLINEETAFTIAALDVKIETVIQRFKLLDLETTGESAAKRRKFIAGLVKDFVHWHGVVPVGEINRWEIRREAALIRRENIERGIRPAEATA